MIRPSDFIELTPYLAGLSRAIDVVNEYVADSKTGSDILNLLEEEFAKAAVREFGKEFIERLEAEKEQKGK